MPQRSAPLPLRVFGALACIAGAALCGACSKDAPSPAPTSRTPAPEGNGTKAKEPGSGAARTPSSPAPADEPSIRAQPESAWRFEAPGRVVAIGDVHGDLQATRSVLRLVGATDEQDSWKGGNLTVVQTGDQLDRGDDERAILDLLERLRGEAERAGGAFHILNGNHELMNAMGDLRYVTPGGFQDFTGTPGLDLDQAALQQAPPRARARLAAFLPGGPYAEILARRNVIVVVGDSVFTHGGLLPAHVDMGIGEINARAQRWLSGQEKNPSGVAQALMGDQSPVWTRRYGGNPSPAECEVLGQTLARLAVARLVVGHTVQKQGVTSACDDRVWRIDVGMAAYYGGPIAALQIEDGKVTVLGAQGPTP